MIASNARRAVCGMILTGAVAGTAIAATPESGTVSQSSPKTEWTGETIGSYFTRVPAAVTADDSVPCEAPSCDTFTLTVADQANLTVAADIDQPEDNAGSVTIRITQPDGTVVVGSSDASTVSDGKPYKMQIKGAKTGDYTIHYWNNFFDGPITYTGTAELAVAGAAAPSAPPASPPSTQPSPSGQPGQPGQPAQPTQAIKLTVARAKAKGRKASARVTVDREVKSVRATLKKGSKTVASGERGVSSGTFTVALKAKKKLKKGAYKLTVAVTDGATSSAKTVSVKVKK